jgi:hypothetical protein
LAQRHDLILHQGDQWRHDNGGAAAYQGGNLKTQRFTAAGRHENEGVAAIADVVYDVCLLVAKGIVTVDGLQNM